MTITKKNLNAYIGKVSLRSEYQENKLSSRIKVIYDNLTRLNIGNSFTFLIFSSSTYILGT